MTFINALKNSILTDFTLAKHQVPTVKMSNEVYYEITSLDTVASLKSRNFTSSLKVKE